MFFKLPSYLFNIYNFCFIIILHFIRFMYYMCSASFVCAYVYKYVETSLRGTQSHSTGLLNISLEIYISLDANNIVMLICEQN